MKREYNEIYGYLPREVITLIPEDIKKKMFFEWIKRKPTTAGWLIVKSTVAALGDDFLFYIFISVDIIR